MDHISRDPMGACNRREFFKATAATAACGLPLLGAVHSEASPFQGELPKRLLGKTGVQVPILGLGTAPAGFRPLRESVAFFEHAIQCGVTYLDTAPEFTGYGLAQRAVGEVIRNCRNQVFVVTKCFEPNGEKALALLKQNLKELQTDYADLVYAHSVGSNEMPLEEVLAPDGVLAALEKARRDGLCRFIGISGHNRPDRFVRILEQRSMDVIMTAVNFVVRHIYDFEGKVWPLARRQNVGLVAMKVLGGIGPHANQGKGARLKGEDVVWALRYAYSLPGVATVVVGCHDREELDQVLAVVRSLQPLSQADQRQLELRGRELAKQWGPIYGPVV
jgi:aryl-alcohol dehydrogenase-like predicted oxidoreductase